MLAILIVLALSAYFTLSFYSRAKHLPPGPVPLPLIGNLPQIGWGILRMGGVVPLFKKWKEEYGDVYTWWMGPLATVNICDHNIANEAMVKKGSAFASRPFLYILDVLRGGRGVIMSNGQHWTEQRRFSLHTLRNFGLGRNIMQDRIMMEFDYRTELLDKKLAAEGGIYNFDPCHFIELTVGNIINRMLFSQRFTEEAEVEFFKLKRAMDSAMEDTNIFDFCINEWTSKIPPFKQRLALFNDPTQAIIHFIEGQVDQRKKDIASGKHELRDEGEDFVDAFLIQMKKKDPEDSFDETTLSMTLLDLWLAGQETTASSLYWIIAYLILNPEVKQKLQAELDALTGSNRRLDLSDKPKTAYLNATISELLRLSSIVPVNLWREAAEDVQVGNFLIPKGTAVTAQLSVLMGDKKHFEEPEKFNPDRFLGTSAEQFVVPFGLGKRACLGESLARAELYLILGNLILSYDFTADPAHPASMTAINEMGNMRKAQSYRINISKRT